MPPKTGLLPVWPGFMDATPLPDIPDPRSPTPAAPPPLPSTNPTVKTQSKVRSMPPPVNRKYRLPGTYAANFGGEDMNWRRGATFLWVLFGLTALGEIIRGICFVLGEFYAWPAWSDLTRMGLYVLIFTLLWVGLGWTRWILVFTGFVGGVMTGLAVLGAPMAGDQTARGTPDANVFLVIILPSIILGCLYLATAGYLAFSTDVIAFVRHRREAGQGWTTAPVALLGITYLLATFFLPGLYTPWAQAQPKLAAQFGDRTIRRMAEHWSPQSVAGLGNQTFDEKWTPEYKRAVFASLAHLGPLADEGEKKAFHLSTRFNLAGGGFIRKYGYNLMQARFAHGNATIGILISKPLFRPWQIEDLEMDGVYFDPKS